MNDLDSEPPPVTPVSPNKRKFSFRFPSVGHHDHDSKNERRNFSDEAQSISDLQVRLDKDPQHIEHNANEIHESFHDIDQPSQPHTEQNVIKIYHSIQDLCKIDTSKIDEGDYVDMSGKRFVSEDVNKNILKAPIAGQLPKILQGYKSNKISRFKSEGNLKVLDFRDKKRNDSCPSTFEPSELSKSTFYLVEHVDEDEIYL